MIVTTERLTLVPVAPRHLADLELLHGDAVVAQWSGPWSAEDTRRWAEDMHDRWRQDGVGKWLAYRRSDGDLVGRGGLSWAEVDGRRSLEVGWAVRERHRGRGYATEIGRAGLAFAFVELAAEEVVAFTEVHNRASRAVMVRLGLSEVGVIAHPGLVEGEEGIHPSAPFALYRLRRGDWITRQRPQP